MLAPISLVHEGVLALHNIYKTTKVSEKRDVLVRGKDSDGFPQVRPRDPWNGTGILPSFGKSLANGDETLGEQWPTLQVWHAGIPCQILWRHQRSILFDIKDENFEEEFNTRRPQNMKDDSGEYRIFLEYEIKRGTAIPTNVAIERDGDNHVCVYHQLETTQTSLTLRKVSLHLLLMETFRSPQSKSQWFQLADEFASDSDLFPFRRWVITKLSCLEHLSKMLSVARCFARDCSFAHIGMNVCISKALFFAWNFHLLPAGRF